MVKKEMHPTVKQFKQLMDSNPSLKEEMVKKQLNLQQFFEQWYVLGENEFLEKYLRPSSKEDTKQDDVKDNEQKKDSPLSTDDVSLFIDNAVNAVSTISGLLSMFRTNKSSSPASAAKDYKSLFQFRED